MRWIWFGEPRAERRRRCIALFRVVLPWYLWIRWYIGDLFSVYYFIRSHRDIGSTIRLSCKDLQIRRWWLTPSALFSNLMSRLKPGEAYMEDWYISPSFVVRLGCGFGPCTSPCSRGTAGEQCSCSSPRCVMDIELTVNKEWEMFWSYGEKDRPLAKIWMIPKKRHQAARVYLLHTIIATHRE